MSARRPEKEDVSVAAILAEHVGAVAAIHMEAFRGYMNTRLGPEYARDLVLWFSRRENGVALCAIDRSGAVLGYVFGAPEGYVKDMNKSLAWPALKGALKNPQVFLDRRFWPILWGRARSVLGAVAAAPGRVPLPGPVISLVGIGVAPSARRLGIGRLLMRAFEERAAGRGMRSMSLSVYPENAGARSLYESAGWTAGEPPRSGAIKYYKILGPAPRPGA